MFPNVILLENLPERRIRCTVVNMFDWNPGEDSFGFGPYIELLRLLIFRYKISKYPKYLIGVYICGVMMDYMH